ncbi:hypothetical protein D3C73_1400840 [compost metagenome]
MTKTRVNTQPHAVARRQLAQLLKHIHRTGIHRDLQLVHPRQRRTINHICGKDNLIVTRHEPRRQRTFNLA